MAALARLIASGLGSGFSPRAPGTAGSLLALVAGGWLLAWSPAALPVAAVAAVLGGVWAISAAEVGGDPGWVVIDEVAGQWIAMLPLARGWSGGGWSWSWSGWPWLLLAFALFRLFDIGKPGPVGWADRRTGPIAVMADDVIAGLLAAALLWGLRRIILG